MARSEFSKRKGSAPVAVRIWPGEESNPLLMFLTEPASNVWACESWQPVGQHGECSLYVVRDTRPATREEAVLALRAYMRSGIPADEHPKGGYHIVQRDHAAFQAIRRKGVR